jgi:aminoglycoside 6-adenylyltransferase
MRTEQEVFELILSVAKADERIRAVMMEGSRANPSVLKDQYQDYDIVYFVRDIEPFYNHPEWVIDKFGEPLIMQMPAAMRPKGPGTPNGNFNYMMIFPDGVRIDLEFDKYTYIDDGSHEPGIILLDKDNGTGMVPVKASSNEKMWHIKPPTELDYYSCSKDFWWCLNNAAKSIARDELGYVMLQLHYDRNELHDMIDWFIGSQRGYELSTGKHGNYYRKLLPPELYERYRQTYSGSDYDDVWRSLDVMCGLFHELALAVAKANGFTYRQHEEDGIRTYLKMMRDNCDRERLHLST